MARRPIQTRSFHRKPQEEGTVADSTSAAKRAMPRKEQVGKRQHVEERQSMQLPVSETTALVSRHVSTCQCLNMSDSDHLYAWQFPHHRKYPSR